MWPRSMFCSVTSVQISLGGWGVSSSKWCKRSVITVKWSMASDIWSDSLTGFHKSQGKTKANCEHHTPTPPFFLFQHTLLLLVPLLLNKISSLSLVLHVLPLHSLTHLTAGLSVVCFCLWSSPGSACCPVRLGRCRLQRAGCGWSPSWAQAALALVRSSPLWEYKKIHK